MNTYHIPIMVDEILSGLCVSDGKKYIDATVGGGGHTWEIVKRGGITLGIDADHEAIEHVREKFKIRNPEFKTRIKLVQGNFREIDTIAKANGFEEADGVLFDLGVSSRQLDDERKGFTYRNDTAKLDMRFDQTTGETAAFVLKRITEKELYEILATFSEEEYSGAIAHALFSARSVNPLLTAGDIRKPVERVVGKKKINETLSRVFQALRMVVNDETGALREGLAGANKILKKEGRIAVLTFHSIEDRIVKQTFLQTGWRTVTKKPIRATAEEQSVNRRSRSAKLRIAQKA